MTPRKGLPNRLPNRSPTHVPTDAQSAADLCPTVPNHSVPNPLITPKGWAGSLAALRPRGPPNPKTGGCVAMRLMQPFDPVLVRPTMERKKTGPPHGRYLSSIVMPPLDSAGLATWRRHFAEVLASASAGTIPGKVSKNPVSVEGRQS